ncbi:MAG: hypothetical protein DRN04_03890 [Thermoprotei archaeon]|nr:MAG: hypothetical protein DRN04_03890 [Thermoprotei archaeon]
MLLRNRNISLLIFELETLWSKVLTYVMLVIFISSTLSYYNSSILFDTCELCVISLRFTEIWNAFTSSTVIYTVFLVAITAVSWSNAIDRKLAKNILSLPISRKVFFASKIISIVIPPYLTYIASHLFSQIYLDNFINFHSILITVLLTALYTLYVVSLTTLIFLIVKNSIATVLLTISILFLPLAGSVPPEFKYALASNCYSAALDYVHYSYCASAFNNPLLVRKYLRKANLALSELHTSLIIFTSVTLISLIVSYIYFKKIDLD